MSSVDPQLWHLIVAGSRRFNLDPRAVAAVSLMEGGGRFGAVGDNGTSYGPWQLHVGGALPAGRGAAWANSRAGVMYALRHMAQSGAAGKQGRAAIQAIVSNFERPADPGSEIAGALSRYGGIRGAGGAAGGMGGGGGGGGMGHAGAPPLRRAQSVAQQMLMNFAQTGNVEGTLPGQQSSPFQMLFDSLGTTRTPPQAAGGLGDPRSGPASGAAAKALRVAKSAIGTPYVWGGESRKGFDCSGLVQWAFGKAGISVPRTTQEQIKQGRRVQWGHFHPGDLIFSNFEGGHDASHVVIYLGHGKVIAAPHTGTNVQIENVNLFRQTFVGARRYF